MNKEKCRCESKEVIEKGICGKEFIWNPSNCDCECDRLCDVGESLYYNNCKCRNKLLYKVVEACSEHIDKDKMIYNGTLNDCEKLCNSCTIYIVLFGIFLIIRICVSRVFIYFYWYSK